MSESFGAYRRSDTTAASLFAQRVRRTKVVSVRLTVDELNALRTRAAMIGAERRIRYSMEELLREAAREFLKKGLWS